jgi:hypothetical protein
MARFNRAMTMGDDHLIDKNSSMSAIVSAKPQRFTGASGGKADKSRDGVADSRITKQPLS